MAIGYTGKRVLDLVLALPAAIVLSPLLLAVALTVRLKLGAPIIFRQERAGLNGQPFQLFKFRSMVEAHDENGNPLPDDDRLVPLGRFLRRTSLDELPELWNVILGEMSLVGPRPLTMDYLEYYKPRERLRHRVRPGITGLAQISGRNVLPWDERLELDVRYVKRQSVWLDIQILFKTLGKVLRQSDVIEAPGTVQGKLSAQRDIQP